MFSFISIVFIASKEHDFCGEENLLGERKVDLEFSVNCTSVLLAVSLSVFLFALLGDGELRNGFFIVFKAM